LVSDVLICCLILFLSGFINNLFEVKAISRVSFSRVIFFTKVRFVHFFFLFKGIILRLIVNYEFELNFFFTFFFSTGKMLNFAASVGVLLELLNRVREIYILENLFVLDIILLSQYLLDPELPKGTLDGLLGATNHFLVKSLCCRQVSKIKVLHSYEIVGLYFVIFVV